MGFPPELVVLGIVVLPPLVVLIWYIGTRNRMVALQNLIRESWSNVDSELQRRYDLIPNLVETVKGYAAHERAVMERVVEARARAMESHGEPDQQAADENVLIRSLREMLFVAEGYPELKADRNFLHLQKELVVTEDRIQAARRFFNGNVRDYNNLVQCFPSSVVANSSGFSTRGYFEVEDVRALQPVEASF